MLRKLISCTISIFSKPTCCACTHTYTKEKQEHNKRHFRNNYRWNIVNEPIVYQIRGIFMIQVAVMYVFSAFYLRFGYCCKVTMNGTDDICCAILTLQRKKNMQPLFVCSQFFGICIVKALSLLSYMVSVRLSVTTTTSAAAELQGSVLPHQRNRNKGLHEYMLVPLSFNLLCLLSIYLSIVVNSGSIDLIFCHGTNKLCKP